MRDYDLKMKDAGLVAADAAGTVDGSAKVADIGKGFVEGLLVVDVTAIEIASNDEKYAIKLQGSSRSDFAHNIVDLAVLELGAAEVIGGDYDSATGRFVVPFTTEKNGYLWPYVRVYTDVSGTIATGINFVAYIQKHYPKGVTQLSTSTRTTTTTTTTV